MMLITLLIVWYRLVLTSNSVKRLLTIILVCISSFTTLVCASETTETVTVSDFKVGDGIDNAALSLSGRSNTLRGLASLSTGDKGYSVSTTNHLSDVVWYEAKSISGTSSIASERIIYYGFNLGRWQRELSAETSVITRVFMGQPLLVFLDDIQKEKSAEFIAKQPEYQQAVIEYEKYVSTNGGVYSTNTLNDLLGLLGERASDQLSDTDIDASLTRLSGKISKVNTPPLVVKSAATSTNSSINFARQSETFELFKGMQLSGRRNAKNNEILRFASNSSLVYGIQTLDEFEDVSGSAWDRINRHFLSTPLTSPKAGFISTSPVVNTNLALSHFESLTTVGGEEEVAFFRNNPNTYLDSPMILNLVTAGAVIAEITGEAAAYFKGDKLKEYMSTIQGIQDQLEPYLKWLATMYTLARSSQELYCELVDESEGVCGELFEQIEDIVDLIPTDILSNIENTLKTQEKDTSLSPDGFCGRLITDFLPKLITDRIRKPTHDNMLKRDAIRAKFFICAFDALITKTVLSQIEELYPDLYNDLIAQPGIESIQITAEFLNRKNIAKLSIKKRYKIKKSVRLESLVFLSKKGTRKFFSARDMANVLSKIMNVSTESATFIRDLQDGKSKCCRWSITLAHCY